MSLTVILIIKIAVAVILGLISGCAIIYIFNRMPAKWLCDYGQEPDQIMLDLQVQRVKGYPWRWIYSAGFTCLLIRLLLIDPQFAIAGLFACWAMLIIGLADLKYMIIPDQFTIMLALTAMGFIPYHNRFTDLLIGAAIGGGVMLLVGILGGVIAHKEALGFGDVKLFASLGLVLGMQGTIITLVGASITAGIAATIGIASGKAKKDDEKPLGPHICGWGIIYIFVIWPFYL